MTPTETVTSFLKMWESPGGVEQAFRDFFTETTIWENVGWVTTVGPQAAIDLNTNYHEKFGMAAIRVETLAIAETGTKVLTERKDSLLDRNGAVLLSPVVMGIFEVEDGKIVAWRDYFDTKSYTPPD